MKKLYFILKSSLWCVLGLFAGMSLFQVWDYLAHMEAYQYTSGPWYLGILVYALLAGLLAAVILLAMWIVGGILRRRERKEEERE